MAVPTTTTYRASTKVATHTALLAEIEAGAGTPSIKLRSASDALIGTAPLQDPAGTVNGTTGQLTLLQDTTTPATVTFGASVAYAEICDGDGDVVVAMPSQAGTAAVSNKVVLNTLFLLAGAPFECVSITIG